MSRFRRLASLVDANTAERLVGVSLVGGGVALVSVPASLVVVGGLILAFDVLDWLLTWKRTATVKGQE